MTLLRKRPPAARLWAGIATLLLGLSLAPWAAAQTAWKPTKPVTIIVPYSPGGGNDAVGRFLAKELQRLWGQPVNVENHAGADGLVGTRKAIDAKPDGYTLLVQIPSLVLNAYLPGFKGVDPVKQLVPVSAFAKLSGVIAINAAIPANSMSELVQYCKTAAQPCSFATTEAGARLRAQQLGTDIPSLIVVNYKGGGQLITDLVGNSVSIALMGYTAVIPYMTSKALKVIMSVGKTRTPVLPDVPTAAEAGFPQLESETWYGLFAPLGTPPEIVESISASVREALKDEGLRKSFATIGGVPVGNTPAEFAALVRDDADKWRELIRRFPIQQ
jgi:tripartite-type tricarboxylate transporter receptor subunit TctC